MNFNNYLSHQRNVVDKEVQGWFYPIDIVLMYGILQEMQFNLDGDICEIGVANGRSAINISNFKNTKDNFYLYDIFSEDQRILADNNIKKFGKHENIVWKINNTVDLFTDNLEFKNELKFLHIDGCHEHPVVLNDLILFANKMKEYGVIAVDDFNDWEYPGVNSAVCEFIMSKYNYKNWRIFTIGNNKAFLCQRKFHQQYQEKLLLFIKKAMKEMGMNFDGLAVRPVYDENVLLCDSRSKVNDVDELYKKLFDKPTIG